MYENPNDGFGHRHAPIGDTPTDRTKPLLATHATDTRPPTAARLPEPGFQPISVLDRVEPRTWGLLAAMVFSGVLLVAVALALFGGGDEATTAAGPGLALPVGDSGAPGPDSSAGLTDPNQDQSPTLPSLPVVSPSTSTTTAPSTSSTVAETTSTTEARTTTTEAPTTTAAPTTTTPATSESSTTATPTSDTPTSATPTSATSPTEPTVLPTTVADSTTSSSFERPGPSGDDAALQAQVLDATNAARAANGCGPLRLDPTLNIAADSHSEDMAARGYFDHRDPEERGPGDRIDATGYRHQGWAENIAVGYGSAAGVVEGWMNSPGHRTNILNCAYDELGVGYADPGRYWTQVFATRG